MRNRSLFGFFIEVLILSLGVYLIVLNIISLSQAGHILHHYSDVELYSYDFKSWHDINNAEFKGFNWFTQQLATFPGVKQTKEFIEEMTFFGNFKEYAPQDLIEWIRYIANCLIFPIRLTITIIADILENVIFFIKFIW